MNNVFDIRTGRAVYKKGFCNLSNLLIRSNSGLEKNEYSEYTGPDSKFLVANNSGFSTALAGFNPSYSGWC